MEVVYRMLSGQSLSPAQLRHAGWFIVFWFVMDVIQFVGWLLGY